VTTLAALQSLAAPTAVAEGVPLVTADDEIRASLLVQTVR